MVLSFAMSSKLSFSVSGSEMNPEGAKTAKMLKKPEAAAAEGHIRGETVSHNSKHSLRTNSGMTNTWTPRWATPAGAL